MRKPPEHKMLTGPLDPGGFAAAEPEKPQDKDGEKAPEKPEQGKD